jgi:predicted dehydrogenase
MSPLQKTNFVPEKPVLNVGILGQGFMGKMHAHAYSVAAHIFEDLPVKPRLFAVAGREDSRLHAFAERFGFEHYSTSWQQVVDDPAVDLIDICLPEHLHEEVCLAALAAGKHILCEKPLSLTYQSCQIILQASVSLDKKFMVNFNYRFLPAVQLASQLIQSGMLGELRFARVSYLQETGSDPDRPAEQVRYAYGKKQLGSIRGLGSHLIDLARFLLGDVVSLTALMRTFTPVRTTSWGEEQQIDADELTTVLVEFANGAVGSFSAGAVATGRKNKLSFEINGARGSLAYDLEKLNMLEVYLSEGAHPSLQGFTSVDVTDKRWHPLMESWWPPAHNLGWEHSHINSIRHFLTCIGQDSPIGPLGATFYDGCQAALIAEQSFLSHTQKQWRKTLPEP